MLIGDEFFDIARRALTSYLDARPFDSELLARTGWIGVQFADRYEFNLTIAKRRDGKPATLLATVVLAKNGVVESVNLTAEGERNRKSAG